MISKKLLSEVLCKNIIRVELEHPNHIGFKEMCDTSFGELDQINIYELAHKCKEWAYRKGYALESMPFGLSEAKARCEIWTNLGDTQIADTITDTFEADTEPEAIFKACEWILKQKDNK